MRAAEKSSGRARRRARSLPTISRRTSDRADFELPIDTLPSGALVRVRPSWPETQKSEDGSSISNSARPPAPFHPQRTTAAHAVFEQLEGDCLSDGEIVEGRAV